MKISNLSIKNNLFLAPMAGVTDRPFRVLCKSFGAGVPRSVMTPLDVLEADKLSPSAVVEDVYTLLPALYMVMAGDVVAVMTVGAVAVASSSSSSVKPLRRLGEANIIYTQTDII